MILLRMLEDQKFIYLTRFEKQIDKNTNKVIGRKLIQLFFAYRQQLDIAARFVAD
jgi:hypothetical protein